MVRQRGGPADRPYEIARGGLHFRVQGKAGIRPFTIRVLRKGKYRTLLAYQRRDLGRALVRLIAAELVDALRANAPVATGHLVESLRQTRDGAAWGGPEPWVERSRRYKPHPNYGREANRRRTQKKTKRRVHKWYGRFANRRSRRAGGFIERSCTEAARRSQGTIRQFEKYRRNIDNIGEITGGRRPR